MCLVGGYFPIELIKGLESLCSWPAEKGQRDADRETELDGKKERLSATLIPA